MERFHATVTNYNQQIQEIEEIIQNQKIADQAEENSLSGTDLVRFLDQFQTSFLNLAYQYFKIHNTMQETKNSYIAIRKSRYPNKPALVFKTNKNQNANENEANNPNKKSNTAEMDPEAALMSCFEDVKLQKQPKTDEIQSPFSAYSTHILANIVKSNITKQMTNPGAMQQPGQNTGTSGFGGFGSSTNNTTSGSGGFSFGNKTTTTGSSGFSFGNTANKTTTGSSGFSLGNSSTTNNNSSSGGGFSFGNTASKPATSGFSFGSNTTPTASKPATSGFSFGNSSATAAKPATGGFSFGSTTTPTKSGFSFGK